MVQEPTQDPQDKAFGAAASEDQDIVDELERRGLTEEELSDEPTRHPRAGGKAEPATSEQDEEWPKYGTQARREKPPVGTGTVPKPPGPGQ